MLIKHEEVLKEVCRRLDIPLDKGKVIADDTFTRIRNLLENPTENFRNGVRIVGCLHFTINAKALQTAIDQISTNERQKLPPYMRSYTAEELQKILDNKTEYTNERSAKNEKTNCC